MTWIRISTSGLPRLSLASKSIFISASVWTILLTSAASCSGPAGQKTQTTARLQSNNLSAAKSAILSSFQITISPPDTHCTHGGFKIINSSDSSEEPVYVCSDGTKRIYEVTGADVSSLPPSGALNMCGTDGAAECLATGNFKAVDSTQLDATKIAAGATVAGIAGSGKHLTDCKEDGQLDCISVPGFAAADTHGLAAKIIAGNTVAGISGTFTPPDISNVKTGVKFGVTGSLQTGTYPSADNLLAGSSGTDLPGFDASVAAGSYQFFKSDGTRVTVPLTAFRSLVSLRQTPPACQLKSLQVIASQEFLESIPRQISWT